MTHIGTKEFESVNMLPIPYRVNQLKLNHTFRIYNDTCPEYMKDKFQRIRDTPLIQSTRSSLNNFFLPSIKNQASHSFFFSAIKIWNSLPSKIKEINNESTFKANIKSYLFKDLKDKDTSTIIFS